MKNKIYAVLQFIAGVIAIGAIVVMWNEMEGHYLVPYGLDFFMSVPFCQTRILVPLVGILFIVTAPMTWRGGSEDETEATGEPSSAAPDQKQNKMQW